MFVFVPTPPPPSKEAVHLGKQIAEAVRILRQENPALRREDVRRGLQLAESEIRAQFGGPDPKVMVMIAALTVMLVGGVVAYFVATGATVSPIAMIGGLVAILAILAAVFAVSRR